MQGGFVWKQVLIFWFFFFWKYEGNDGKNVHFYMLKASSAPFLVELGSMIIKNVFEIDNRYGISF